MSFIKAIASNTFFQIVSRLASSSAGFLIAILIARHFGIEGYGNYAKVTAFVGLFYLFVDFGFNAIFLQREDGLKKIKQLFLTRIFASTIIFCLVVILAFALPYDPTKGTGFPKEVVLGIIVFALTLFSEGIVYSASAVFQKQLSYKSLMISSLAGSLSTLLLVFLSIFLSLPLLFIFISFVLGGFVKAGVAIHFSNVGKGPEIKAQKQFTITLVKSSLPVALMLVLNLIYFRIDTILLSMFSSTKNVAIYDFAYKFFDFLIAIPLYLSNTLYPGMIEAAKNKGLNSIGTIKSMFYFSLLSFLIVIPAIVFAPFIGFIKKEFMGSVDAFRILVLSLPFFFATSILQWTLLANKKQIFLIIVYLIGAIVNIVLNLVFIPQYGYIASSIITGISEAFILLLLFFPLSRITLRGTPKNER